MSNILPRSVLAVALSVALAVPSAAASALPPVAAAQTTPPLRLLAPDPNRVKLDLSPLEPIDPGIREEIANAIHRAATDVLVRHRLPANLIHVEVGWRDPDTMDYSAKIRFDAKYCVQPKEYPVATGPNTATSDLAGVIAANLERRLSEWDRAYKACPGVAPPQPTAAPPDATCKPPPDNRRLFPVGWGGVGLIIVGAGSLTVGAVLATRPTKPDPADASQLQTWQPSGYSLLAVGGAFLVAGTVLTLVGANYHRDKSKGRSKQAGSAARGKRRGGALAAAPWLGRSFVGAGLTVGF